MNSVIWGVADRMSNKICSADIESLFSEYLVAGEYVICCQATAENASLTDRGVIVPPKENRDFKDGIEFIAVGLVFIFISLIGNKRSTSDYIVHHSFMTTFIIIGILLMFGFNANNKGGAYAITNIRAIALEKRRRPRYIYLKDVVSTQIFVENSIKNIGLIRMFTHMDIPVGRIVFLDFNALDSPDVMYGIARKQIAIAKRENSMDDIVPEVTDGSVFTCGSRRISRNGRKHS
jgi:hypothetical protein